MPKETFAHELEARRRMQRWEDHVLVAGSHKFGTRRRPGERETTRNVGRNRLRMPVDLRCPAMPTTRPADEWGNTSFHYALSSVNAAGASDADAGALAVRQENYISGGLAQDPSKPERQERYVNAADVGVEGDEQAVAANRVDYVKSNISDDLTQRLVFWQAVNKRARKTGAPTLEFHPLSGTISDWQSIAHDPAIPQVVREVADAILADMLSGRAPSGSAEPIEVLLLDPADQVWAKTNNRAQGRKREDRMLHFRAPRSALLQQRLEAELPYELDEAGRRAVVDAVAADLDRLDVRYTIVIHHPETGNDQRNFHIHILIYPCQCRQAQDGSWDFASQRKLRPGEIQRVLADTPLDLKTNYHNVLAKADVTTLRERFARHCNVALCQTDAMRRFDPRSYVGMGIDQQAGAHLGGARSSDVAAGLPNEIYMANVKKAWDGERRRMEQRHSESRHAIEADIHGLDLQIAAAEQPHRDGLKTLRDDYVAAHNQAYKATVEIDRLDLEDRIGRLGAEHLERHMLAWIVDARSGKSTPAKRRDLPLAEARLAHARRHLAELDRAFEPWAEAAVDRMEQRAAADARANDALNMFKQIVTEAAQVDRNVHLAEQARVEEAPVASTSAQPALAATSTKSPSSATAQPRDRFAEFNALIAHIRDANPALPIVEDLAGYHVPALREADRQLLQDPDLRHRAQAALASICKHQEMSIERLLAFAREHGEPCLFAGIRRNGSLAPESIVNLYKRYRQHPSFRAQIDAAHAVYETMRERERAATATPSTPTPRPVPVTAAVPSPVVAANIKTPAPSMPMHRATGARPEAVEPIAQLVPPLPKPEPAAGSVAMDEPEAAPPSKGEMAPIPLPPVMPPVAPQVDDDVSVRARSDRAAPDELAPAQPIIEEAPAPVPPLAQPIPLSPFAGLSAEEAAARKLVAQAKKAAARDATRKIAANAAANIARPLAPTSADKVVAVEVVAQPEILPTSAPATVAPPVVRPAPFEAPSPVAAEPPVPSLPPMDKRIEDTLAAFRMKPAYLALPRTEWRAFDDRAAMVTLLLGNGNLYLGFDEQGQVRSKSRLEARLRTRSAPHVESHSEWVSSVIGKLAVDAAGRALLLELARATVAYPMPEGPWHPKIWYAPDGRSAQQAAVAVERRNFDRN